MHFVVFFYSFKLRPKVLSNSFEIYELALNEAIKLQ